MADGTDDTQLPKTLPGWEFNLAQAAHLLDLDTRTATAEAIRLLDQAVGLKSGVRGYKGTTLSSYAGCKCLPIYLVRRVEYESAMRRLNWSEMQIGRIHGLFSNSWYIGDVKNVDAASEYLLRATLSGNRFAKQVFDWISPQRAKGIGVGKGGAKSEYLRAISEHDRDRAVHLGRMLHAPQADSTQLMRMSVTEQKALAANNIGFQLARGRDGVPQDAREAVKYYELAIGWGSASAACNLGHLLHYGAEGVARDGIRAQQLYVTAIERGERNYAPRNLAILVLRGAAGVQRDVPRAARCLLLGLREGNERAQAKCANSLRLALRSWRLAWRAGALRRECQLELQRAHMLRLERLA